MADVSEIFRRGEGGENFINNQITIEICSISAMIGVKQHIYELDRVGINKVQTPRPPGRTIPLVSVKFVLEDVS